MNANDLAIELSTVEEIESWQSHCSNISASIKHEAYKLAEPLWVKRMLEEDVLLVHPEVAEQLKAQHWVPNDLQKKMIWASVLAIDESSNSKKRFYIIKDLLINKYGKDWWEDVYQRKNSVYAAKERIRKIHSGPVVSTFIVSTHLGTSYEADEKMAALKMIAKT